MLNEPLKSDQARLHIRMILKCGITRFTRHANLEMVKDGLSQVDVVNVLRAGLVENSEFINGSWRYRVRTNKIYVVVCFRNETTLIVITAWRK